MTPSTKSITLFNGEKTLVSAEWYERLSAFRWFKAAGGYVTRKEHSKNIYMARFIMNAPTHLVVDHIDGDKLNNQLSNLRICTRAENLQNRGPQANNSTGLKGDAWQKQKLGAGRSRYASTRCITTLECMRLKKKLRLPTMKLQSNCMETSRA